MYGCRYAKHPICSVHWHLIMVSLLMRYPLARASVWHILNSSTAQNARFSFAAIFAMVLLCDCVCVCGAHLSYVKINNYPLFKHYARINCYLPSLEYSSLSFYLFSFFFFLPYCQELLADSALFCLSIYFCFTLVLHFSLYLSPS